MTERTKNRVEGGFASQSIEDYTYDAFNLVRGYRVRRASAPVDGLSACRPDASTSPADVWSYRFGPLQEREQKRQLVSSADTTLAWVYTLVGADGRQLATYNGLQGSMCGRNGVRLWPVEFNTYGPNNTRIITRADGTSEVVISDYLGSARVTLSTTAEPLQSSSYHPFGTERTSTGSGARTSYIGREHDKETDLGFYGVRLYEPEYGRFLSTDPLWGEFPQTSTYVYADNEPITKKDPSGLMPTALVGFAIGAAIEIGFQVVVEGKKPSEIDGKKVLIAGAAGALTGGVSSIANATVRAGAMGAISAAEGAAKRMVDGDRGINVEKLGIDATLGYFASKAADRLAASVANSVNGKSLARELKRAENVLDNGRTRASHVANVVSLRESVASLGRGPGEEAVLGTAKEAASRLIEPFLTPAIQRDNTNVQKRK
jgi:RHS repeat-associated protein